MLPSVSHQSSDNLHSCHLKFSCHLFTHSLSEEITSVTISNSSNSQLECNAQNHAWSWFNYWMMRLLVWNLKHNLYIATLCFLDDWDVGLWYILWYIQDYDISYHNPDLNDCVPAFHINIVETSYWTHSFKYLLNSRNFIRKFL